MNRTEYLSEFLQDVRYACRQSFKHPGFTLIAVLTLALGIGSTTAIFSVVHAVVLRPLPIAHPERVLAVYETFRDSQSNVSAGNYVDGIEPASSFEHRAAVTYSSFNLGGDSDAERVIGASTTSGFFDVFGAKPMLGRVYTAEEDQPGRAPVIVLSHRLWTSRFGADPEIIGRQIRVSARGYDVIGVMPASFDFVEQSEALWVPIAFTAERKAMHDEHYLQVYAKLRQGVTIDQARAELTQRAADLRRLFPKDNSEVGFMVMPLMEELVGNYRQRLFILLGAVGFVLLIACGNVANLMLARGAARSGELAIRTALGAGRGRLVRQLLTESTVIAIAASAAGLALAWWGVDALVAMAPDGIPRLEQTAIDPVVLAFTLVTALASAILFGLAPALRAARADVQTVLKEGGRGAGMGGVRDRLRTGLIAAEIAIALVLMVGAGLLIRSSLALQRAQTGFDPKGVLSARLALPAADYPDATHVVQTFERLAEAARAIPGVESAGITSQVPMSAGGNGNGLIPEGRPLAMESSIQSRLRIVTPGYLETMKIQIVRGRSISDADRRGGLKVMVISEALAHAAFPDQDAIGKRIVCCEAGPGGKGPDYKTVVGIARDVRWRSLGEAPTPEFYLPAAQAPDVSWDWIQRTMYIALRTAPSMDPSAAAAPLRSTVARVTPGVPLFNVQTMEWRVGQSVATARFNTLLLTILGVIGLVLSAIGIYGVIAYFVTRRTQEIGVRMALGATRRDVTALVVRQAAWPIGLGLIVGIASAAALTRVLSSQLFEVRPNDPLTFGAVAATLVIVALVASLVPARRAVSIEPTRALHMN
jgi:predicted permease